MSQLLPRCNHRGQPIGPPLPEWTPPPQPERQALTGRFCRLEPLEAARHAEPLFEANALDADGRMWTYLPCGPFAGPDEYRSWAEASSESRDPLFFAILDLPRERATGIAAYLRITPGSGSIEVGHLAFSPALQRTPAATEAIYLLMEHAFALGYRRFEWKCDSLNAPSRAAAQRLGFSYEGLFRQATVYKGRSRDTAWYSVIDAEWPALQEAFRRWLAPTNFDAEGRQRERLSELTRPLLQQLG
jgi:RimJ/RimL family protein N-acetyltransferase